MRDGIYKQNCFESVEAVNTQHEAFLFSFSADDGDTDDDGDDDDEDLNDGEDIHAATAEAYTCIRSGVQYEVSVDDEVGVESEFVLYEIGQNDRFEMLQEDAYFSMRAGQRSVLVCMQFRMRVGVCVCVFV